MTTMQKVLVGGSVLTALTLPALGQEKTGQPTTAPAESFHKLMEVPVDKLVRLANQLIAEVRASLIYDRRIAILKAREDLYVQAMVDCRSLAEAAKDSRVELRTELDAELGRVKQLHGTDSAAAETEMVAVIELFRPQLLKLAEREKKARQQVEQIETQLRSTRRLRVQLEQQRALGIKMGDFSPLPSLVLPQLALTTEPAAAQPAADHQESLDEALQSLAEIEK